MFWCIIELNPEKSKGGWIWSTTFKFVVDANLGEILKLHWYLSFFLSRQLYGTSLIASVIYIYVYLYINLACLSGSVLWCLSVCLYPINVKTAEPIRPKFCVGPHVASGKVYGQSEFKYVILKYLILNLVCKINFVKFWKCAKKYHEKKIILYKEKKLTYKATIKSWKRRWAGSVLKA